MGHDEFCLVCAVAHNHGPDRLRHDSYFTDEEFAQEMLSSNPDLTLDSQTIVDIIKDVFDKLSEFEHISEWLPDDIMHPHGFRRSIAIGHWSDGDDREGVFQEADGRIAFPKGRGVQVYLVDDIYSGMFTQVITVKPDGETVEEKRLHCEASDNNPCFFIHQCCCHYLRAWLDWGSFPKPVRNVDPPLTFEEELYEIRLTQSCSELYKGPLPCLDYGGAEGYLDQYQEFFAPMRRNGSKALAEAIREGLRGEDLVPAIMLDFRVWMFISPDIWPVPSDAKLEPVMLNDLYSNLGPKTCFDNFPKEILQILVTELPVDAYLKMSATCRRLRCQLFSPPFTDYVFKSYMMSGPLRWILPVSSFRGEVARANEAASLWLDASVVRDPQTSVFAEPSFPHFDFVRACYMSFSMMNRRRLWGMVMQFNSLWMDYRKNGWEVNRFYDATSTHEE